jgi:hypothetical protein
MKQDAASLAGASTSSPAVETPPPVEAEPGVCAYLRGGDVLVVVPVRGGAGTEAPAPGRWRPVLTGSWPVALLERA